jgi:hypothetical protein
MSHNAMQMIRTDNKLTRDERLALPLWLEASGFKVADRNKMWVFVEGVLPGVGELEFELPTPENESGQGDKSATSVIALIGHTRQEDFEDARFRITGFNRDLYKLRVGERNFIPLIEASRFPAGLRSLLGHAYAAEADAARPFFPSQVLNKKGVRAYEFGHTIRGSFVITVRSPLHGRLEHVYQRELNFDEKQLAQLGADEELDIPSVVYPVTRRVSERIVRSLALIQSTSSSDNKEALYTSYGDALNAGMSSAIADIVTDAQEPVTFHTIWSPSLPSPDDELTDAIYSVKPSLAPVLQEAAEQLRLRHPEKTNLSVLVTGMESDSPPLVEGGSRKVFARWMDKQPRPVRIQINVENPEVYRKAQQAHNKWVITNVRGVLHESRGRFLLTDVEQFGDWPG